MNGEYDGYPGAGAARGVYDRLGAARGARNDEPPMRPPPCAASVDAGSASRVTKASAASAFLDCVSRSFVSATARESIGERGEGSRRGGGRLAFGVVG